MNTITVGISDLQASNDPEAVFITHALGSCISVILHDPVSKVGGMIHYMLPLSKTCPEKAKKNPAMFADTGVPMLFERMYSLGSRKKDIVVKVAGGGKLYEDNGAFEIGKRNYTVLRKILWKNNIIINAEDVGGTKSRTVRFWVKDGRVLVKSRGAEEEI